MLISEIIVGVTALLQGLLLVGPRGKVSRKGTEWLALVGLGAAALFLIFSKQAASLPVSLAMLEDHELFRVPRAALLLSGVLLSRIVSATHEVPEGRKPEVLFLLSVLAFLCDLLILSRHGTLSCILLVLCTWVGLFLGGLAYRGRREGEAVLKFWTQASLALTLGFGSIVLLSLVAGGAHFEVIGAYVKTQPLYSPQSFVVVTGLFLPFFMAAGFFPFHFITIDRDHGLPWSVQTILSVMFQGAIAVACWKMGVEVFGLARREGQAEVISEGLRVLQLCGLIGGFWLALFALSQENSKRLYSALVGAQWSAILAAGALPTLLSATAIVYSLSASFLWTAILGFVWSRFQERAGSESITAVYGAAKAYRTSGLILLLALASPLCVPGFPGLPGFLYLLASMIEQKSLIFLATEVVLLSLLCLTTLRIGTDLLFRQREIEAKPQTPEGFLCYSALDWGVIGGLTIVLLASGFFWHSAIGNAASLFLQ
jgi:NADH:ubiquinone oxidoreductase subunit 2 (subunit N)